MVFRFKGSSSIRAYIGVLIIVIITLSAFLCIGTMLGVASANITEVDEHPRLKVLNKDSENETICSFWPWEQTLFKNLEDLINDLTTENKYDVKGISDVVGTIKFVYWYHNNNTYYGIGETSKFQGAIWISPIGEFINADLDGDGMMTEFAYKWQFLDYEKSVRLADLDSIINNIMDDNNLEFLGVLWLILIADICFAIILGLFVAFLNPYGRFGVGINLFIFRRLNGRLGRWLNVIKLFDLEATDQWFVERHIIYGLDFSNSRKMSKELLLSRWRDFWFMPAAIVVFFMSTFEKPLQSLILTITGDKIYEVHHFVIILFILSIFVALLLAIFYPSIWCFTDIGLKKYRTSHTGDIEHIGSLGVALRRRLEILFGFTTVLSLSSLSLAVVSPKGLQDSVPTSGSILTIIELVVALTSMIAFFLLIVCFVIPIIIVMGLNHFARNHVKVMTETRKQLVSKFDTLIGTIQPNVGFAAEDEVISVYYDAKEEKIQYKSDELKI